MEMLHVEDSVSLPLRSEELSPGFFTDALSQRHPGTEVTSVEIGQTIWGTSTKVWVNLSYNTVGAEHGLPASLVVKAGFDEHSRSMSYMHDNEIRFYRHFAPRIEMNTPHCYFAGINRNKDQSLVILEDLKLRGAQFFTGLRPLNYRQISAFLSAQARYHAQWWEHPELQPGGSLDWVSTALGSLGKGGYASRILQPEMFEQENWSAFMDKPHGAALSTRLQDADVVFNGLMALAQMHQSSPITFCHGDTHLGNLFMEPDGKPGFLDAQMRRAPWYADFSYNLIAALDPVDRREFERPLLAAYLRQLTQLGVDAPAFEEAWFNYRCQVAYGLLCWIFNTDRFQTEAINTAVCMRFGTAAIDHGTFELLRSAPA